MLMPMLMLLIFFFLRTRYCADYFRAIDADDYASHADDMMIAERDTLPRMLMRAMLPLLLRHDYLRVISLMTLLLP